VSDCEELVGVTHRR